MHRTLQFVIRGEKPFVASRRFAKNPSFIRHVILVGALEDFVRQRDGTPQHNDIGQRILLKIVFTYYQPLNIYCFGKVATFILGFIIGVFRGDFRAKISGLTATLYWGVKIKDI